MRFEAFWDRIKNEMVDCIPLKTLKQDRKFTARYIQEKVNVVPQSSREPRDIRQEEFIIVWNQAKNYSREQQFVRQNYNDSTRNGSYILAIFRHVLRNENIE